ncbi:MAG TPA: lysophospholipid acyltransferase family protein [Candidatus Thermoplasmatota archaeon]|nr:lysophospholipid acyltransferase family protein [Candidatus Thermoplasmatota archaeon]
MPGWGTPDWREAHWMYRGIKAVFHYPLKWLCRIHARGWEGVPREGGVVLVSNHWSWADPVLLQAVLGRPGFYLAKESVFTNRFNTWFFTAVGQIKVDREKGGNDAAIVTAVQAISEGKIIGVYPEGTRSTPPDLLPFKSGAVRIALLTGAPIVPVGTLTDRFWPKGKLLPRFGRRVYIAIGGPMVLGKDAALANDREACHKLNEDLQSTVRGLLAEAMLARERKERWRYP